MFAALIGSRILQYAPHYLISPTSVSLSPAHLGLIIKKKKTKKTHFSYLLRNSNSSIHCLYITAPFQVYWYNLYTVITQLQTNPLWESSRPRLPRDTRNVHVKTPETQSIFVSPASLTKVKLVVPLGRLCLFRERGGSILHLAMNWDTSNTETNRKIIISDTVLS